MGKETKFYGEEQFGDSCQKATEDSLDQEKISIRERERELEEVKVAFSSWKEALDERDRQHTSGTIIQRTLAHRLVKQRQRKYSDLKKAFDTKYGENK